MSDTIACWLGIMGAILLALKIEESGYAYLLFLLSSMLWMEYGDRIKNHNIIKMNFVFCIINIIGIIRWLIT